MIGQEFNSAIVQKGRLLPGIHGLRGLAALAVILFHLNRLTGITPPNFFEFIGRDFGFGVHLFFILSAYSLMYSTESRTNQPHWLTEYFVKRFFRIAPLFYFMIALEITRQIAFSGRILTDLNIIFLNLTFTFGFVPFVDFIWAGWAVGVEMIFYLIFPVLILTTRTHRSALVLLFMSILISTLIRSVLFMHYLTLNPRPMYDVSYLTFAPNFCFFAMGIYAYHVSRRYKESNLSTSLIPFITVIIIGGLIFFDAGQYFRGSARLDIILWGLGLMALCVWQSLFPCLLIANRICGYLGERSFSIYLLHPVIIFHAKKQILQTYQLLQPHLGAYAFFVCAVLIIALILFFAEFSYRIIEVPGIKFGRKLIKQRTYA